MPPRFTLAAALALALVTGVTAPARAADPGAAPPPAQPTAPSAPAAPLPPADTVVARIDGTVLRLSDVEAVQQSLPQQAQKLPLQQIYPILLDRLVDGALVTEAGRKEHLDQNPEVELRLRHYQDHLIQQAYIEQLIKGAGTDDQLKARYQQLIQEKPQREEVHARHILVKTEGEAKSIIAQLDKGADFATLAKKYSTDPGAASGGDLGYFGRDDMVPAFAAAAFALPVGKYTETPVKTEFGWHVILVEDRRVKKAPTFAEAREEISRQLARDAIKAKLAELRSAANIETFGLDGKPLPQSKLPQGK
ncbi:MAG TPA: peptidylprolyl isomerase [Stellaceae bacterium]|nr:peptidylprolyl isomerase [Stellaceae bacterium]